MRDSAGTNDAPGKPAVFLDRDGTIIEDVGYLDRLELIRPFPWAMAAIRALNRAGFLVIVVTNQSGVAKGYFTEAFVEEAHRALDRLIGAAGGSVTRYYHCPHHPDGSVSAYARLCDCRKPGDGLIVRAVRDLGIDPVRSFVVGDKWVDIGLARNVAARGILVRTGTGATEEARPQAGLAADAVADNLAAAASWILMNSDESRDTARC